MSDGAIEQDVAVERDPHDPRRAAAAPGLLRPFNDAGVLTAADVHVAVRLARLAKDEDAAVIMAAALAVRAPRLGHVFVDLATVQKTTAVDGERPLDLDQLPWPVPEPWLAALRRSDLVALGEGEESEARPLRLIGSVLYLDRYWREERAVAADLTRLATPAEDVDLDVLAAGIAQRFGAESGGRQALAAAAAVLARFAVVAGGPGTGKTTTVAHILGLLAEQAAARGAEPPLVALAAPTGKAAARLEEAVHAAVAAAGVGAEERELLLGLSASTLHRLLGWRPDSHSHFRHHRGNRLPHDVVVVDETSMVSLTLMGRLVEAVRADARLVLVGDPGQLLSIEAGAVLADIVGPTTSGLRMDVDTRQRLGRVVGRAVDAQDPPDGAGLGAGIVVLDRVHRFGGGIAALAGAIRGGDADAVITALRAGQEDVTWLEADAGAAGGDAALARVRTAALDAGRDVFSAAREGATRATRAALEGLTAFRVLCAHRRGAYGVGVWGERVEGWLAEGIDGYGAEGRWYVGRPLLVTENDYGLRLYNGDTGVIVTSPDGDAVAAFDRGGAIVTVRPSRLGAVETAQAITIHKSQGSQFGTVAVVLPDGASPILTRELLYTAVTRAQRAVILVGTEAAVRAAVQRPVARASGLRARLWRDAGD